MILDLCSSWISHLPEDVAFSEVVGLGMNEAELEANKRLSKFVVQDLNKEPRLAKLESNSYNAVLCTVSVDYLIRVSTFFVPTTLSKFSLARFYLQEMDIFVKKIHSRG